MAFPITPSVFHVALDRMSLCHELGIAGVSLVSLPIGKLKISESILMIKKHKNQKLIPFSIMRSEVIANTSIKSMDDLRPGNNLFSNLFMISSATSCFFAS